MRAAEHIAFTTDETSGNADTLYKATDSIADVIESIQGMLNNIGESNVVKLREDAQKLMSGCAAHIRQEGSMESTMDYLKERIKKFDEEIRISNPIEICHALKNRDILIAQLAVLSAIKKVSSEIGSKGSGLVTDKNGEVIMDSLSDFSFRPGKEGYEDRLLITQLSGDGFDCQFKPIRPMPKGDDWFENVWNEYIERTKRVYK